MTDKPDDGGPAFPVEIDYDSGNGKQTGPRSGFEPGMSLRDYFAAQAMHGITSAVGDDILLHRHKAAAVFADGAKFAYQFADAMLEARKR